MGGKCITCLCQNKKGLCMLNLLLLSACSKGRPGIVTWPNAIQSAWAALCHTRAAVQHYMTSFSGADNCGSYVFPLSYLHLFFWDFSCFQSWLSLLLTCFFFFSILFPMN
ncbi:hypothetical protein GDO81_025113 [Engystomops pustulosus]|uniref:Uncharacterized protein n=1 Tax=Engystomops pustulosus TaxID=76066 RepID=A0AAV6Z2E2_ENGPU|nr:hypothetical protein GDO81_025113 [Engystomops pustulosus]